MMTTLIKLKADIWYDFEFYTYAYDWFFALFTCWWIFLGVAACWEFFIKIYFADISIHDRKKKLILLLLEHTGEPSFSLKVTSMIGFSQTAQTKWSGCHDFPKAVKTWKIFQRDNNKTKTIQIIFLNPEKMFYREQIEPIIWQMIIIRWIRLRRENNHQFKRKIENEQN